MRQTNIYLAIFYLLLALIAAGSQLYIRYAHPKKGFKTLRQGHKIAGWFFIFITVYFIVAMSWRFTWLDNTQSYLHAVFGILTALAILAKLTVVKFNRKYIRKAVYPGVTLFILAYLHNLLALLR